MLIKLLYNIKNLSIFLLRCSPLIFCKIAHGTRTAQHDKIFSGAQVRGCYLRPVRGCTMGCCVTALVFTICLGLLTLVLDLANSNLMVCGRSGSNLTPCCNKTSQMTTSTIITRGRGLVRSGCDNFMIMNISFCK